MYVVKIDSKKVQELENELEVLREFHKEHVICEERIEKLKVCACYNLSLLLLLSLGPYIGPPTLHTYNFSSASPI